MTKKKIYEAPTMEQMECKVERGFAGSDADKGTEKVENSTNSYDGSDFIFS